MKFEPQDQKVEYADAETKGQVDLKKVKVSSGEEGFVCLFKVKAKMYRWRDNQWKERGMGWLKLQRDNAKRTVRFLHRQDKKLTISANFFVTEPLCQLALMGNGTSYSWSAVDNSEGEPIVEKFSARFKNSEVASTFRMIFEGARVFHTKAQKGCSDEELVWASTVEDIAEVRVDDIEDNIAAEKEEEE